MADAGSAGAVGVGGAGDAVGGEERLAESTGEVGGVEGTSPQMTGP